MIRKGRRYVLALLAAGAACLLQGCVPDDLGDTTRVTSRRILAIRVEPAEALPGETVRLVPLVASTTGTVHNALIDWASCLVPKRVAEPGGISDACARGEGLSPLGVGVEASFTVPLDACTLFGPETTSGEIRPRDADGTGGYYAPVRADLDGETTFASVRLRCTLGGVAADAANDFAARYAANQNPQPPVVTASATSGGRWALAASWSVGDAESYVAYDAASATVRNRREAMRVSFFVTAGVLAESAAGRAESDLSTGVTNSWSPPRDGGSHGVYAVLRDARGGVAWAETVLASPQP